MYITLTAFKTVVYKMTSDCVINLTSVLIQFCVSVVVEGKPQFLSSQFQEWKGSSRKHRVFEKQDEPWHWRTVSNQNTSQRKRKTPSH